MTGTDRRRVLLDAALDVVALRGLRALTHRAVDAAANLPQGSTVYYWSRKAALVDATLERLVERLERDSETLQHAFAGLVADGRSGDAIDLVSGALLECLDADRDLFLARVEFSLAASRDPALKAVGDRLGRAARRPMAFYLKLLSGEGDGAAVETCLALLDGLALAHATGQMPSPSREQIADLCRSVIGPRRDGRRT